MKRKIFVRACSLAVCALVLFSLAACGREAEQVRVTAAPALTPDPMLSTPAPQLPSEETQKTILKNKQALWAFNSEYESPWFYTFTDLDHNGRLEVIAACTQGSGFFTYARMYEVTADGTGIENCYHKDVQIEGPDDWPEITVESLPCCYDRAADRWYYLCENVTRDGAARYYSSWNALCLKNGVAEWEPLAYKETVWDENGNEIVTCTNAQGAPVSAQEYDSAAARRFPGTESSTLSLNWTRVDNPASPPQPQTAADPVPAPVQTVAPPVITKNPTSESLAAGGKTWFIAHAQNAASITWQFMGPDGAAYTIEQAMAMHPGLVLQALEGDTVAVSNVPASADGWGMRARFDGPGGSVYSDTAFLRVKDYARVYGGIIENYRVAFRNGYNTDTSYMWEHGLSEMASASSGVGYALTDLDGNGIPELIIAPTGDPFYPNNVIYCLYTLVNDVPIQLAVSQARDRYYLLADDRILNEGSGGAAYSTVTALRVQGDMTVEEEMLFTWPDEGTDMQSVGYYFRNGHAETLPGDGSVRLTDQEFSQALSMMESAVCTPQLTAIW